MFKFSAHVFSSVRSFRATFVTVGFVLLLVACGPDAYQKHLKDFQDAANTVIAADREFLSHENTIEQDLFIDQQIFERKPFGPADVDKRIIITAEEIKLRTDALDALSQYTTSLATLASGKSDSAAGQKIKTSSSSLKDSANASSHSGSNKDEKAFDKRFSGLATAAATGIAAVAQAFLEHKARAVIKTSVRESDKDVTALIAFIGEDAQGSYLRQQSQLSIYGVQLYKTYQCEIDTSKKSDTSSVDSGAEVCPQHKEGYQPDPAILLTLSDRLKTFRSQQDALAKANPQPAIVQLQKAHEALVAYISADKNSENLSDLLTQINNLFNATKPLEQAIQNLTSAAK